MVDEKNVFIQTNFKTILGEGRAILKINNMTFLRAEENFKQTRTKQKFTNQ